MKSAPVLFGDSSGKTAHHGCCFKKITCHGRCFLPPTTRNNIFLPWFFAAATGKSSLLLFLSSPACVRTV